MSAPAMTLNTAGDLQASTTVSHLGTPVTFTADFRTKFEGQIQFSATFGTVAATAGLQISVLPIVAGGSTPDTVAGAGSFVFAAVASSTLTQTIKLPTGKYSVSVKNLDTTNDVTSFTATSGTIDSI